jgi:hypothetical protein
VKLLVVYFLLSLVNSSSLAANIFRNTLFSISVLLSELGSEFHTHIIQVMELQMYSWLIQLLKMGQSYKYLGKQ